MECWGCEVWPIKTIVVVVQSLSHFWLFETPWIAACLPSTVSWSAQSNVHRVSAASRHLILCHPFSFCLQSFPAQGLFQCVGSDRIRWPKYWTFSFSNSPSNEYSGLIYFGIDRFDFLAVQGTLKSLIQHHSSKASVPWCSALYMVQLTSVHDCWKTIALTIWTFVGKVMSLLYNLLSNLS